MNKGVVTAGERKTVSGKAVRPVAGEGQRMRDLIWLTAADVKILAAG